MKSLAALCFAATLLLVQADTTVENSGTTQQNDKSSTILETEGTTKTPEQARQHLKDKVVALTENCKTVAKVTMDQSKIATNQGIPKTEAEKCFLACIYDGIGITKDGQFNEVGARVLAQTRFGSNPEELSKAIHMIDGCSKEVAVKDPNEKCALGRLVRECIVKHGDKINFFPKP